MKDNTGKPEVAVGNGQGKTGEENTDRGSVAEQPEAGWRVRKVADEQPAWKGLRREQGQSVRPLPDTQPAEEDAGSVLQLDSVRAVLLRSGAVHGRDRRQHIHQRRVFWAHRVAGRVHVHIPVGEVRPEEHPAVGQLGDGHGLHTDHVPTSE